MEFPSLPSFGVFESLNFRGSELRGFRVSEFSSIRVVEFPRFLSLGVTAFPRFPSSPSFSGCGVSEFRTECSEIASLQSFQSFQV